MSGTALAQSATYQSVGNGLLVTAKPGGVATATGSHADAAAIFTRLYLGNGWFVLQNKRTALCLSVDPALGGLITETRFRDGDQNEQFQDMPGATAGSFAAFARGTGKYVTLDTLHGNVLIANAATVSSNASFIVTPVDQKAVVVGTPDFLHARQRILGFGGALVFNESRLALNPYQSEVFHALFDPKDGLGITFLRIGNNYQISETDAGGYADYNVDLVQQASAALTRPVGIIMSGWGPPGYLKSNGSTTAGTLRTVNGSYDYAGYAKWWADSIKYWHTQGIDPTFVSIQNEPEVDVTYISNHFNPVENEPFGDATYGATAAAGYGKALDATFKAFKTLPSAPSLIGPEPDGTAATKVQQYMAGLNPDQIVAIAHHLYDTANPDDPDSFNPTLQSVADDFPDKPKMMTEWLSNDAPIVEAKAIHATLVTESTNAYIKWSLANSATVASAIYDDDTTKPPSTWLYPHGWHVNDNYYVMKHYAYVVRPGFQRYDTYVDDPDLRLSAYVDPASPNPWQPRGAAVVLNTSPTRTISFRLQLPAGSVRNSTIYRTSFLGTERWHILGTIAANPVVVLPPNSMVSYAVNSQ